MVEFIFDTARTVTDLVLEQLSRLHYDLAGQPFPRQVPGLLNLVGADRLLYGSDYSWVPSAGVGAQVAALRSADIPGGASSWEALTTANALRLFPALASYAAPGEGHWAARERSSAAFHHGFCLVARGRRHFSSGTHSSQAVVATGSSPRAQRNA